MVVRGERRMADEAHKVIQKTRILTKLKIKEIQGILGGYTDQGRRLRTESIFCQNILIFL